MLLSSDLKVIAGNIDGGWLRWSLIRQDELHSKVLVEEMVFQFRPTTGEKVVKKPGNLFRVVDEKRIGHPDGEARHENF